MENREYAREVMGNLRQSSADLEQILHKINAGQGTIGKLVNNPELYDSAQKLVSTQGWGVAIVKAIYGVVHPLSSTEPGSATCVEPQAAASMSNGPDAFAGDAAVVPAQVHEDPPERAR